MSPIIHRPFFSTLFLALSFAPAVLAQTQETPVTITVSDERAGRIPKAQIKVDPAPDRPPAKMETDARGELSFTLKPGEYVLFVTFRGFATATKNFEASGSKEPQTIQVVLKPGTNEDPVEIRPVPLKDRQILKLSSYSYSGAVTLSPADFKALPHTSGTFHNPYTNETEIYSGVPLEDLLSKLNAPFGRELHGAALACYIVATGADGYKVILALAEIDPALHPGIVLVADAMSGHMLDPDSGPYVLIVTEDRRPARQVRNLVSIELKSLN
jgi:hypothetical protein